MIKRSRIFIGVALFAVMLGCMSTIQADEWNKRTIFTFSAPISIPGTVLAPGTYVFKLLNSSSDRNIVQVFNADQKELLATIFAIPDARLERTGKTVVQFWEVPSGTPVALRAWFYPGDYRGFAFAYPKPQANAIAARVHHSVPVLTPAEMNMLHSQ